jgi:hypothetical protein
MPVIARPAMPVMPRPVAPVYRPPTPVVAAPVRPVVPAVPVPPPTAVPPATGWNWLTPAGPAAPGLPNVTSGSLRLGTVAQAAKGADVGINVISMRGNDTVKFTIAAQINGNWTPIYNIATPATLTPGWQSVTLHVNYDEINSYLHTVNPALNIAAGTKVAVGATFSTGHNTGMPGWTSNNGSEQDVYVTLP